MLIDNVKLTIKAGNGGNGSAHLLRNGQTAKGGPDGGHGGNGGNIYVCGSHNLTDLADFRYKKIVKADSGTDGAGQKMFGRNADDITIYLPLGTRITDEDTGKTLEIVNETKKLLIAKGGAGGLGNIAFKSATNQTPTTAEHGKPGDERHLFLELRLIAEIGLIGLPNAGKSSILSVLTNAKPAVGAYPFTTLEPTIGMLGTHPIADIPGLIQGASDGKGLGINFLKHIEKTKILLHCIDASITSPKKTYDIIRKELEKFSKTMIEKPEYILLTKTDLVEKKVYEKTKTFFEKLGFKVFISSIYDQEAIDSLKNTILQLLTNPHV